MCGQHALMAWIPAPAITAKHKHQVYEVTGAPLSPQLTQKLGILESWVGILMLAPLLKPTEQSPSKAGMLILTPRAGPAGM